MSKSIRVAIAGVGSCASALIQGVEYYRKNPTATVGVTYEKIGDYSITDLQFVVGFDVDWRKVGLPLEQAIFSEPNCNMKLFSPNDISLETVEEDSYVYRGPTLDGISPHMKNYPDEITFIESPQKSLTVGDYKAILLENKVDVLINYMPVGSDEASKFYIENAIECGVHIINCMPSYISTESAKELEKLAFKHKVCIVGSDMRSAFGASRLSEVLQGSMLDSGLNVTQHIQTNMAAGTTQGQEGIMTGRSANTDFLNMAEKSRLHSKHISKENVLNGQSFVRNKNVEGTTMFAGPSLTVVQKPGGEYIGSDNKIANLDIVAYGWGGARYELTARLSVQDSPNSAGIVADAIRFCMTASEMEIIGYLRGVSAWTQKTPPLQMTTSDAKFECDALSRTEFTKHTMRQTIVSIDSYFRYHNEYPEFDYTFQKSKTDYE
jgi:myo-inositol-1-phosphate synthase